MFEQRGSEQSKCKVCGSVLNSSEALREHEKTHRGQGQQSQGQGQHGQQGQGSGQGQSGQGKQGQGQGQQGGDRPQKAGGGGQH